MTLLRCPGDFTSVGDGVVPKIDLVVGLEKLDFSEGKLTQWASVIYVATTVLWPRIREQGGSGMTGGGIV